MPVLPPYRVRQSAPAQALVLALASLLTTIAPIASPAQTSPAQASPAGATPTAAELQPATAAFARGDWQRSLEAYRALAGKYPTHALSRFRIGVSLVELRQFAEGEASLREGERLGMATPTVQFRLAESFAEQGKRDEAIAELMRSAAPGNFIGPAAIASDPHFTSLTSHPKWQVVLDAFDAKVRPCMHDARARNFDFWIGDWDVRPTGTGPAGPPARNTVTLENNGCTVVEHWVASGGSEGQSFNLYDSSLGKWRQTWVDNVGGQHDYRGNLVGRDMTFEGDTPAPGGALGRVPTKLTFFHISDDSVRQFSQTSTDSGKTWTTAYDLMYVRRKEASASRPAMVPLSAADHAAILALDSTFVAAWLADDTTKVLSVFAADAELLPPGAQPVIGVAAIRAYWWPADGSHTRITAFTRTIGEVSGTKGLAYVRGTGALSWTYVKAGGTATSQSNRSTDLIVYKQDAGGRWQVARQMWNALP
jgi:ketosteroid isomerase-like protein